MKHLLLFLLLLLFSFLPETVAQSTQKLPIQVTPLTKGLYVHTSWKLLDGNPFPSNGLIAETKDGVVLVDTGWGEEPTKEILDWVEAKMHKKVTLCIVSHGHDDRLGGITVLQQRGIKVISTKQTAAIAAKDGHPQPEGILPADSTFTVGGRKIRTFYPGPGHTSDNITVWFPTEKVLFGGCFVKSTEAPTLGNIADADLKAWPNSLRRVISTFPDIAYVVPGHQSWKSKKSLQHTLDLLAENEK